MPYIDSLIPSSGKSIFIFQPPSMEPEMEKPRITEIKVRMDCNGCVQKIKKALQGINGIYDLYIDFPQQKLTIIGCADPVEIVKALKKTRKSAVICSHMDQPDQPTEQAKEGDTPEGGTPPSEHTDSPVDEAQTEAAPPAEEQHDSSPPEEKPAPETANATSQPTQPFRPKEIHVIYRHPPEYGYKYAYDQNFQQSNGPGFRNEPFQSHPYPYPYPRGPGYGHPRFENEVFQPPYTRVPSYTHPGFGGETFQPYTRSAEYRHPGFGGEPFQAYTRTMGHIYEPSQTHTPRGQGVGHETSQHYTNGTEQREGPSQAYTRTMGHIYEPSQTHTPRGQGVGHETSQHYTKGTEQREGPSQAYTRTMGHIYEPSQTHIRGQGVGHETSQHYTRGTEQRQGPSQAYTVNPGLRGEAAQSVHVSHSYNTCKPSSYVTEYAYPCPPPPRYSHYSIPDHYSQDYYSGSNSNGNGNITSMFSEENPNACRIA